AYTPLIYKLSRADGSQRIERIETVLPAGLTAKLAGVRECSEADIAKARSREAPQMGALEQSDPSCPASSQVAPATPPPPARAHRRAPYRAAPLRVVALAPAVAGPFDLGTVVSRIAIYLDPTSARVRAVSDPLPQLLDGVPVDLRSISLRADRPQFSRNP